jgi:hypothetical protein
MKDKDDYAFSFTDRDGDNLSLRFLANGHILVRTSGDRNEEVLVALDDQAAIQLRDTLNRHFPA